MADDPKAAPSLADEFAMLEFGTYQRDSASLHWLINNAHGIFAALRAVEAVRALHVPFECDGRVDCQSCLLAYPCPTAKALC